jgi:hypothetical protein
MAGRWRLDSLRPADIVVQLSRVNVADALELLGPDAAIDLSGRAEARLRVSWHSGLRVTGPARLTDAQLYGIPISEAHGTVTVWQTTPQSLINWRAQNVRGSALGGTLEADISGRIGRTASLESRVRVERGNVELLSGWAGTSGVVGRGRFDASLTLGASRLTGVQDLQGAFDLQLANTEAQTLPLSTQLARFVPLFGFPSTEFVRGGVRGSITAGNLRIRDLALWGPQISVLGSGVVGMTNGRLDLQLVVRTGGGFSQQVAAGYLARFASTAVPPAELLLRLNRLLANRALYLGVTGTASQPVIQPQAAQIVGEVLLRSLLEQAAPLGAAAWGPLSIRE